MAKTWVELSQANLLHNIESFFTLRGRPLLVAVKGNAYGHGLKEVVAVLKESPRIAVMAVDAIEEAHLVRESGWAGEILIIGWLDDEGLKLAVANDYAVVLPAFEEMDRFDRLARGQGKTVRVHIKVETGTVRLGMLGHEAVELLSRGNRPLPGVEVVGIYSHFANIEDTTDHRFAHQQLSRFKQVLDTLPPNQREALTVHFSCSASALVFPESLFDLVRLGISAYGYWPSKPVIVSFRQQREENGFSLKPVLSWYSRVAQVKTLPAGTPVGYGLSYRTLTPTRLAVIPVGYYDGYDRQISNQGLVLIRGQSAPIRGRICMNMFMVDVGHIEGVRAGDRVTLLGTEGDQSLDASVLGDWSGTIHYEVLSRINPTLPRVLV